MLGHMQHVLEDAPANENAHEPNVDQEHNEGAGAHSGQHFGHGMAERESRLGKMPTSAQFESTAVRHQRRVICGRSSYKGI